MSLQWTLITGFLYMEIFVLLLLILPIASIEGWNNFFKSKYLQGLQKHIGIGILVLFSFDAIREMHKYSGEEANEHKHLDDKMEGSMRLLRAQYNLFNSGCALFLSFVIRRLVSLIALAALPAQLEASMGQAQSAQKGEQAQNNSNEAHSKDKEIISELKEQVKELEEELNYAIKDKIASKQHVESVNNKYDRLTEEYSKLQKQILASDDEDKKEN